VSEGRLRVAIAVLAFAGAAIASYLAYARYAGAPIVCATGGCETVQRSRYSELAGVPVAVLGLALFLSLLGTVCVRGTVAAAVGAGLATAGALFAAYLLALQVAVIGAVCQWCVASDAIVAAVAVLTALRLGTMAPPLLREST